MASEDDTSGPVDYLFLMAKRFIDVAIPESAFEGIFLDIGEIMANEEEFNSFHLLMNFSGLITCLVVGLLFLVISPFVGFIFCGCRCCGNCGGHRKHDFDKGSGCWRIVLEVFLLVFVVFCFAAILCMFLSNEYLTESVPKAGPAILGAMYDMFTFVGHTTHGLANISDVLVVEFNNTRESIITILDDIGEEIETQVVSLLSVAGLDNVITIVDNMQRVAEDIGDRLNLIDGNLTLIVNQTEDLQADVVVVQTLFQDAIDACLTQPCRDTLNAVKPGIDAFGDTVSSIDTSQFRPTELNDTIYQVNAMLESNFSSMITQEFDRIPQMVSSYTGALEPVKDMLRDVNITEYMSPVVSRLDQWLDFVAEVRSLYDVEGDIEMGSDTAMSYLNYVRLAVSGFLCLPGLVVVFEVLGLLLGVLCTRSSTPADLRNASSNTAGCCLMTSVAFAFVVSWILMALTALLFLITTPFMVTLCRLDFDYMIRIEKFLGDKDLFTVVSLLPDNFPINLTISGVISKCDKGNSFVDAMDMDDFVDQFINQLLSEFNVTEKIQEIADELDLSSLNQISSTVGQELEGVIDVLNQFDMNIILDQLGAFDSLFSSDNPTAWEMAVQIINISSQLPPMEAASAIKLNETADQLRGPVHFDILNITDTKNDVVAVLGYMDGDIQQILVLVNETFDAVVVLEQYMLDHGESIIITIAHGVLDSLLAVVDSFIDVLLDAGRENLQCKPVTDIYNTVIHETMCGLFINPLNGFWFCMGQMVFFFTFSIIVAVRLAKYFRRMDYAELEEELVESRRSSRATDRRRTSLMTEKSRPMVPVKQYGYIGNKKIKQQHFKNRVFPA